MVVLSGTLVLLSASLLLGQGPLTAPGAPAPTMKTLQELWDKVGGLETTVNSQQQQVSLLQQQNSLLLSNANINLPWQITTLDSTGNVGWDTSLTFTPGGQPAISYYNATNADLEYAVFNGTIWTLTTVDSPGAVGQYSSLAFTTGGQPAISYYDITNGDLNTRSSMAVSGR